MSKNNSKADAIATQTERCRAAQRRLGTASLDSTMLAADYLALQLAAQKEDDVLAALKADGQVSK